MHEPLPSPPAPLRRRVAAITMAAVLIIAPAALSAAPADAATHRSQTRARAVVTVSDPRAPAGHRVTISGAVRWGSEPLARQRVAVQQRTTGTAAWRTLATATTTQHGLVSVKSKPLTRGKQFRIRVLTNAVTTASTVAAVAVPTWLAVTATSPLTPTAGDAVVLAGTASPQLAGRRVYLQVLVGTVWKTVASSQISGDATFNVHGVATLGGDQEYRALVNEAPGRPAAVTDSVGFTVFAWYRLGDLSRVTTPAADRPFDSGRLMIGGLPYEQSVGVALQEGESGSATWSLDNRCSDFRATLGAAVGSSDAFTGRWRLFADDDLTLEATLTGRSAEYVTGIIAGTADLRLRAFALSDAGTAAWGNAEVLCAGRP